MASMHMTKSLMVQQAHTPFWAACRVTPIAGGKIDHAAAQQPDPAAQAPHLDIRGGRPQAPEAQWDGIGVGNGGGASGSRV